MASKFQEDIYKKRGIPFVFSNGLIFAGVASLLAGLVMDKFNKIKSKSILPNIPAEPPHSIHPIKVASKQIAVAHPVTSGSKNESVGDELEAMKVLGI